MFCIFLASRFGSPGEEGGSKVAIGTRKGRKKEKKKRAFDGSRIYSVQKKVKKRLERAKGREGRGGGRF